MENQFKDINTNDGANSDGGNRKNNIFKNHSADKPLISIITAVYNSEKYLEECFNSLHNQTYQNYEHILVDGGSTDNSLSIIKKYNDKIDYWSSKRDKGIYDAFNIGMQLSKGTYLGFLNSDDILMPKALETLVKYIKKNPDKDFIFGAVKKHWGVLHGYKPYKIKWSWGFYSSHSTGFYIKRDSAKKVGLYDLQYKYSSDYDYLYRMIVHKKMDGIATKKNEIFGEFRRGGFSSKIKFIDHFFEEIKIRVNNKQNKFLILFIIIYKFLKHINKI